MKKEVEFAGFSWVIGFTSIEIEVGHRLHYHQAGETWSAGHQVLRYLQCIHFLGIQ